jgi:transcriptional regulator with XRE-family HTH domain
MHLQDQVNILFETSLSETGRSVTLLEVSNATGISATTLSQLRTGKMENPQLFTLRGLCKFFGVPLAYFDCTTREACFTVLQQLDSRQTISSSSAEIALRAARLSAENQAEVLKVLAWIEAAEKSGNQRSL